MIRRFYGSHIDSVLDMGDEYYNAEALSRDEKDKSIDEISNIFGRKTPTLSEKENFLHERAKGTALMLRESEEAEYIETEDDSIDENTESNDDDDDDDFYG